MSRGVRLRFGLALLAAAGLHAPGSAAEPGEPTARVELLPEILAVDESALLVLEVTIDGPGGVRFEPAFELDNLVELSGPSSTRTQQWVNGRSTSGTRLSWRLRPGEIGPAAVREIRLRVDGRELRLPDREIRVVSAADRPPRPPRRRLDPFDVLMNEDPLTPFRRREPATLPKLRLSAAVSSPRAYVGEQLVWELLLDTQADVSAFRPKSLPEFEGFWVRELPVPERARPESIRFEGEAYWRVASLRRAIFPLRAGRFRLGAAHADVVARIAEAGWFGPFARSRLVSLATDSVEIEVLALPDPPESFSGAIGELRVSARVEPTRVPAGTPATLTVAVSGFGNLSGLQAPRLLAPRGLRVFEPTGRSDEEPERGRLRTTRTWSWIVVGEQPGSFELAPAEPSWFDPGTGTFRASTVEPVRLDVVASRADAARPHPVSDSAGEPRPRVTSAAAAGGVAAVALAVGLGAWGALVRRRRRPHGAARARLERRLAEARCEPAPGAAAAALGAAWRAWLHERWGFGDAGALPLRSERLAEAGLEPEAAARLAELFRELHDLRFAPELSDLEGLLQEAYELSEELLRELA